MGIIGASLLLVSCSEGLQKDKPALVQEMRARMNSSYPQVYFLLNPDDCSSCLLNFTNLFQQLGEKKVPAGNILLVLPAKRPAEQEKIKSQLIPPGKSSTMIWDDDAFATMFEELNSQDHQSFLVIKKNDSIVFAKPVKDIAGTTELDQYLTPAP